MLEQQPDHPLISVICVSYNSPDLRAALDSALAQTYPAMELILVDDASRQFDAEAVKACVEHHKGANLRRFVLLRNAENIGTVHTINRGLRKAKGRYIFQLAGDDAMPDAELLTDWVQAFQRTGALAMAGIRANYDEQLRECHSTSPNEEEIHAVKTLPPQDLFERIAAVNFLFGSGLAFDRRCFERYGLYDEHYRLIEDHPMCLRLLRQGVPIVFFDRVVVKYRGGGTSGEAGFNAVYEKDTDAIFRREILPYTRTPRQAKRRYYEWKCIQTSHAHRARYPHDRWRRLGSNAWYCVQHPIMTATLLMAGWRCFKDIWRR